MALPEWHPPNRIPPSPERQGEESTAPIYSAVGQALSEWEFVESALIKLFQLLCETDSFAACRAYGTIMGPKSRADAIDAAAEVFFENRDQIDLDAVYDITTAYSRASTYRNHVAHGVAVQPHAHGYFLCPPSYAKKKFAIPDPAGKWALGAEYFYRVADIDNCKNRFGIIRDEIMQTLVRLNEKYRVLEFHRFHP
jgi:hypothetical protein